MQTESSILEAAKQSNSTTQRFVSIVVPCLNEEMVIGEFVDWCFEGLKAANVAGEVLIIDSSTDKSPEIAEAHGARVLRVPKRGLGHAYLDALPHIRGNYVIMGDADLTYDFRKIADFVAKLDEGYEFVMGTRLKGYIEPGAMPPLHRYFGTPLTTIILNTIYHSKYSDIHCGMRAMTLNALKRIDLQSTSWEYASEMVLKSSLLRLKTTEIPINFYKDREGRQSHHKRSGWFSPWLAGWINLKVMFLFAPDFFLFWPSIVMLVLGLVVVLGVSQGQVTIGQLSFNLHWMLFGMTLSTLGYSALHLALLARAYHNFRPKATARITRFWTYNRGMLGGGLVMFIGFLLDLTLMFEWIGNGLRLTQISYIGVLGLLLLILGFQTITHTLILQMILHYQRRS
ncbi:MAG: glycosyltransferase family 2 protein [Chloroflexi bacterium]|nr:glycosyltransferase family 2 protein [Chloroflexota bacterium]